MKKLLALVCTLGLVGWMVGCGEDTSAPPAGGGAETPPQIATPEATGAPEATPAESTPAEATPTTEGDSSSSAEEPKPE